MKKNNKDIILIVFVFCASLTLWLYIILKNNTNTPTSPEDITQKKYSLTEFGFINISSSGSGSKADIASLDHSFFNTVNLPVKIKVPVGNYSVTVYKPEYFNFEKDITVNNGDAISILAELEYSGRSILEGSP